MSARRTTTNPASAKTAPKEDRQGDDGGSSETGYFYAVQMFGRPKSASITFQVANRSDTMVEYQIGERSLSLPPRYTRTHERCRPAEMTFRWQADGQQHTKTIEPDDGNELVISSQQEGLNIRLQYLVTPKRSPIRAP